MMSKLNTPSIPPTHHCGGTVEQLTGGRDGRLSYMYTIVVQLLASISFYLHISMFVCMEEGGYPAS